ncbi:hypothetical protein [Paraburkholderia acidipaludis]|uniref:hypothetical protein n=1 Tax=Paraburkholderia acidipaludis TaxID=660537 RepID=UPI0012EB395A|nr:hypothetical protein [Paraburkholderia acidipaludis]
METIAYTDSRSDSDSVLTWVDVQSNAPLSADVFALFETKTQASARTNTTTASRISKWDVDALVSRLGLPPSSEEEKPTTEAIEPVDLGKVSTILPEVSIENRPRAWPRQAVYAAPIEIFEGVVQEIDPTQGTMQVNLRAKTRATAEHTADISLRWVNPQDRDLVRPGAVFYLSLYRELRGKTIRNTEDIRFRRLPAWTKSQVNNVRRDADRLLGKLAPEKKLDE